MNEDKVFNCVFQIVIILWSILVSLKLDEIIDLLKGMK